MEAFLVGLVGVIVGTLVAAFGVRVFFLLLPAWGFIAGFVVGAGGVSAILGEGFAVTVLGWGAGIGLGVLFAILAGVFFWASILILAGTVGWALVAGLLLAVGMAPGLLPFLAGLAGAAALIVLAIAIDAPTVYVAVLTSLGGAAYAVAGALLMLGRLGLADLEGGPIAAMRGYPVAAIAWLGLAALALGYQLLEARARSADLRGRLDQPALL
ncbi:MAG TPA: hypothetical protein VES19_02040 [Candidatus Limnocylindrales bacterium]|nr:hypothetical protein [Candidatus Limnocylindrales bacterium]